MPDLAVTLMVILGFLGGALCLRAMATSGGNRSAVRAAPPSERTRHAMMDE
ncbi:hypothetical protein ACIP5Y_03730 [Nocardia sp. NPDC088792]|uniref:hypothetical protein n=1 Tax=Nocardia sp. NPDC088792 TaxID=3364332 RepID=UPI0037FFBF2C